jgi:hypothetical protein
VEALRNTCDIVINMRYFTISFDLGELVATHEESGAMTGINRIQVVLTRQDLGAQWQCRVNSAALTSPLVANLRIDVHGKILSIFWANYVERMLCNPEI